MTRETILLVDDDARVVSALQRSLHRTYEIEIASSAKDGLEAIEEHEYAVTVSDFKMPDMNGVEFLTRVKQISPDTVRILLTGYADVGIAIAAVNDGNIFRLLTKPCPHEVLTKTLDAALVQYRLITAESAALRETLTGTVAVLIEMLSAVQPLAFGAADRVRRHVRKIAAALKLKNTWELEAAAMLSTIGCVSVPPSVLRKYYSGQPLTGDEMDLWGTHPQVGRRLLESVPRLKSVTRIVERQMAPFDPESPLEPDEYSTAFGAQILRVANDLERLLGAGRALDSALDEMRFDPAYNPAVVSTVESIREDLLDSACVAERLEDFQCLNSESALFRPITDQVLRALRH